jgi:hypothetical protein
MMRQGLSYMIIGALLLVVLGFVWDTREDLGGTRQSLAIGCERANRTREALHWLAEHNADIPDVLVNGLNLAPREKPQADKPWLVDCDAAFP